MRHLRVLCTIADSGSLRKAALHLGMTQPSLTTQLHRIERAVGGTLFTREQTGSRPTALGHSVLSRARPVIAEMAALVAAARQEARNAASGERARQLRIGSVGSRVVAAWLRRVHERLPETDTTIHIDISANALLRMVAADQLDVAFVHESEGFPLRVPADAEHRVLMTREPQFVALAAGHPAAARPVVHLADLAEDTWMVDPTADHEYAAMRRVFTEAGLNPRVVQVRDNATAAELVASGEAVRPCQPTSAPGPGTVVRPVHGDPLTVRLLLAWRPRALSPPALDALYGELRAAYLDLAQVNPAYRAWLSRQDQTLHHLIGPSPDGDPGDGQPPRSRPSSGRDGHAGRDGLQGRDGHAPPRACIVTPSATVAALTRPAARTPEPPAAVHASTATAAAGSSACSAPVLTCLACSSQTVNR
ncbi:LysR family transcriptional regulator [Streptomyces sp. CB01881]|nr:LysR family transcriptional regulator [Streptomyces sp. CB01881]TYC71944.1 LysR family transcriptional regulator [Streptomyces sp. CB01881]